MEYTYLGRSGLQVSRLCLGTMHFGDRTDEKESFRIMDAALDAGINFFDTANVYGGSGQRGLTEEIIGKWFSLGGDRRDRVILATKVYHPMQNDRPYDQAGPNEAPGLSAFKIRRHLEDSLQRLQTDRVELYQMHHIDRHITGPELWGVFDNLVQQGKILYVGSSNFAGWHLAKVQAEAEKRNSLGLVSEQHMYSLLCRWPELEVLPAAKHLGIGVIPYMPYDGGLLTGKPFNSQKVARRSDMAAKAEKYREALEAYSAFCESIGLAEIDVALAWVLANPAVTAPIIGCRTLGHLEGSLRSLSIGLDAGMMARLDEIFPGPGMAPEGYAW